MMKKLQVEKCMFEVGKRHTKILQWHGMAARREWQVLKNDTACINVWDPQLYEELLLSLETTALLLCWRRDERKCCKEFLDTARKKTLNNNNKPNQPTNQTPTKNQTSKVRLWHVLLRKTYIPASPHLNTGIWIHPQTQRLIIIKIKFFL